MHFVKIGNRKGGETVKIIIEEIGPDLEEELILRCRVVDEDMLRLLNHIKTLHTGLVAAHGETLYRLTLDEIFYFEIVDGKGFFYCRDQVYEARLKLYAFEEICRGTGFFRASKSMILNADKIVSIAPSLSGRFTATLSNGEKVVVSRQYVNELKRRIGMEPGGMGI